MLFYASFVRHSAYLAPDVVACDQAIGAVARERDRLLVGFGIRNAPLSSAAAVIYRSIFAISPRFVSVAMV